jgi:hypothetical protein
MVVELLVIEAFSIVFLFLLGMLMQVVDDHHQVVLYQFVLHFHRRVHFG